MQYKRQFNRIMIFSPGFVIKCLPFDAFIPRYDRQTTLFYLDQPYRGSEGDYGKDPLFQRPDFERLAHVLGAIKGRFIVSLNDIPEVRELFAAFDLEAVETTYHVAGGKHAKRASNRNISNMG